MPATPMIFISHTHEDNDLCAPIVKALHTWNVESWIDREQLSGGDQLDEEINQAILNCTYFVRICTSAAIRSPYMDRELVLFTDLQDEELKTHGETHRKLIPLIFSDDYKLHLRERTVTYIKAIDRTGYDWLDDLRRALDAPESPGFDDGDGCGGNGDSEPKEIPTAPPGLKLMLAEMDQALEAELKKVADDPKSHTAIDGQFVGRVGNQYVYTFALPEPWEPRDDAPIRVKIASSRRVEASVVTSSGNSITIAVNQELSEGDLRRVSLYDDPRRLLEKMREVLQDAEEGPSQLGSKTFNLIGGNTEITPLPPLPDSFSPNASQENAIQKAWSNEVSYIIGPPGTGKTATLAMIAYSFLKKGHAVLIAAHTNIAVDNAILKLADFAEDLPQFREGRIVRFGPPQLPAVRKRDQIYPPKIVERQGQDLDERKAEIQALRIQLVDQLQSLRKPYDEERVGWQEARRSLSEKLRHARTELQRLQRQEQAQQHELRKQFEQVTAELNRATQRAQAAQDALAQIVAKESQFGIKLAALQSDEEKFGHKLATEQSFYPIIRVVRKARREKYIYQLSNIKQEIWHVRQSLAALHEPLQQAHSKRADSVAVLAACRERHSSLEVELSTPSPYIERVDRLRQHTTEYKSQIDTGDQNQKARQQELDSKTHDIQARLNQLNAELADIEAHLANLERDVVTNAQVIATTLSKIYMNSTLAGRRFDVVILDEVSIAPLPAIYIAAALADKKVVVVGDPMQLSPIYNAKENRAVQQWLGRDLFEVVKVGIESAAYDDPRSVLLNEQFRMDPHISVIARRHVYDGYLTDAQSCSANEDRYAEVQPVPGKSLVLCDTSGMNPLVTKPESGSRYNQLHIEYVMDITQRLLATLPAPRHQDSPRVGIVTPYKAQAQWLQKRLKDAKLEKQVQAGTIHKFQGLEFEAVIFDTVESPALQPVTGFTRGGRGSKARNLINVAVTRAQHKLIIVANVAYLKVQLGATETLMCAIEEAQKCAVIQPENVLTSKSAPIQPGSSADKAL